MLRRTHVSPFVREGADGLVVDWLDPAKSDGARSAFLDRLCRLVRRMEGRPRHEVAELLRRQERRVRDVRRLSGISKALLDACRFRPAPGADRAEEIREALFRARGRRWPPVAGDELLPYRDAAAELELPVERISALLHADRPDRRILVRAPGFDGAGLLFRYNLELARAVLLDAESLDLVAEGGWKGIFRALKLSRLMARIEREGRRRYRVRITGPAAPWVSRPQRYGVRLARVLPSLLAAPGARIDALVHYEGRTVPYRLDATAHDWLRSKPRRGRSLDSKWEEDLAGVLREKLRSNRSGWTLVREDAPIPLPGGRIFLPDFTLRHRDGREALVELVGFWTPEYLEHKLATVADAGLGHLVLVVSRRLAEGGESLEGASKGPVVWFTDRPSAQPVLKAAERVAREP